jgi:hypothetical protein
MLKVSDLLQDPKSNTKDYLTAFKHLLFSFMPKYTAKATQEYGIGQGVNGTGKRKLVKGAYTIETATGRKVRAFRKVD